MLLYLKKNLKNSFLFCKYNCRRFCSWFLEFKLNEINGVWVVLDLLWGGSVARGAEPFPRSCFHSERVNVDMLKDYWNL